MSGVQGEELLVAAGDQVHHRLGLRRGADVVLRPRDCQERHVYPGEVYVAAPEVHLAPGKLVLLVEVRDPLLESRAGERRAVVDPLVHGEPGLHRLVLEDALPHVDVGADVVGDGLEHPVAGVDHLARDVAECLGHRADVYVALVGKEAVHPQLFLVEVYRGGHQDQVLQVLGEQRGVHRAHRAAHAVAVEGELIRAGVLEDLPRGPRDVVEDVVLEAHVGVFVAGGSPVEQIYVVALVAEELYEGIARHQVQYVGLVD